MNPNDTDAGDVIIVNNLTEPANPEDVEAAEEQGRDIYITAAGDLITRDGCMLSAAFPESPGAIDHAREHACNLWVTRAEVEAAAFAGPGFAELFPGVRIVEESP